MNQKAEVELSAEADAAAKVLSGMVARLVDDGVQPAALVDALASALGVMMAAAPRHMADALDASVANIVREHRAATWAALDAAPVN